MQDKSGGVDLTNAFQELHQYLSDQIAPLMAADSVGLLMQYTPEPMVGQVQAWASVQYRRGGESVTLSDYFYHALKKLHMMGSLKLVPAETHKKYIEGLGALLVSACPQAERALLQSNIAALGQSEQTASASVQVLHRQAAAAGASAGRAGDSHPAEGQPAEESLRSLRRFSVLLERLERSSGGSGLPGEHPPEHAAHLELMTQALTTAATSSRSGGELDEHLERLRQLGFNARVDQLFRDLGRSLPGWAVPIPQSSEEGDGAMPATGPLSAMYRLITLTEDRAQGALRFRELVASAIERFNEGALGPAITMIDLANKIVAERRVEPAVLESVRSQGHAKISHEMLRSVVDNPDKHPLLRKVMDFFTQLSPRGLLDDLGIEPRREQRRLILMLLEAHGASARKAALERFEKLTGAGAQLDEDWYLCRNLLYLLRRIPRQSAAPEDIEREIELVAPQTAAGLPPAVVREAVGVLGQTKDKKAERALIVRLSEFEALVMTASEAEDLKELRSTLDSLASALAHFGTRKSWRALVDHALRTEKQLGDTVARLGELGDQDLSADPETVERLVKALRDALPVKLLGFSLKSHREEIGNLIEALAGTPAPAVREVFEEIGRRFADQPFGQTAAKALANLGAAPQAAATHASASLTGDLEVFGLPNLLQSLSDSRVTGSLLISSNGQGYASMTFREGKIGRCQAGKLSGEDAFCQLFEKPLAGSFGFTREAIPPAPADEKEIGDVLPILLEGIRRHDELRQASVIVPDAARLSPTGKRPTLPAEESDQKLVRTLWARVSTGLTPAACEEELPADAYRLRRLLAHWVEEGALQSA